MGDGNIMQIESSSLLILSGTVSSSAFLEDQPDDDHIIMEGKVWSPEVSILQASRYLIIIRFFYN